ARSSFHLNPVVSTEKGNTSKCLTSVAAINLVTVLLVRHPRLWRVCLWKLKALEAGRNRTDPTGFRTGWGPLCGRGPRSGREFPGRLRIPTRTRPIGGLLRV